MPVSVTHGVVVASSTICAAALAAPMASGANRTPTLQQVLEERDPERQLRVNARNSREGKLRIAALAEVIRSARPLDPDIEALWNRINTEYHANQRAIVESLNDKGALNPRLDVARGSDILWMLNHPNTWQLLITQRGWTPEQYEQWAGDTACAQLLDRRRSRGSPSGKRRRLFGPGHPPSCPQRVPR